MKDGHALPTRIIRASLEHVDDVAPLFDAYRGFYSQPGDLERGRQFLIDRLRNDESVIFFALAGDGINRDCAAGFTQLYPVFSSVRMKPKWILNDLFVAPPHRRIGVGRLLMLRAIDFARETNSGGLELSTGHDNFAAQTLYESVGFTRNTGFHTYELNVD